MAEVARVWISSPSAEGPPGDHVPGGEVLQDQVGQGTHVQGVDLDDVSGLTGLVFLGLARSVGAWPMPFAGGDALTWRLSKDAARFESGEDVARHGSRDPPP